MMPEERRRLRNLICMLLCVLAACALGYLYYIYQQREAAYSDTLKAQQEEAKPYEEELWELQAELANLEDGYVYSQQEAGLMVGFLISELTDLSYIEEMAQGYALSPVLVLDCVMEREALRTIVEAADESWEIMLYATDFSEAVNDDVLSTLSELESIGRSHTGVFFLRHDDRSDARISLLEEDGFTGYTVYTESTPSAGQTENGAVYFDYSYLTVTGTAIETRLSAFYNAKTYMIVVFDMANINAGTLSKDYVLQLLDVMCVYTENDDCAFVTVADAVEELSHVNEIEAQYRAEYEKQAALLQERIMELKEKIAGIYGTS